MRPELFSRGQKRPLFSGAAAKSILAWLPPHQLKSLFAKHRRTIAAAGLGADWDAFRKTLRQIREDGYCITSGEFNPGIVAIGAPLFNRAGDVLGSLSLAASTRSVNMAKFRGLTGRVVQAAGRSDRTHRLGAEHDGPAGPRGRLDRAELTLHRRVVRRPHQADAQGLHSGFSGGGALSGSGMAAVLSTIAMSE